MDITVVIPAYNEEGVIKETVERIYKYLTEQEYSFEIIVVDDGSDDHTSFVFDHRYAKLIRHGKNRGKGYAVKSGVMQAMGEYIFFTDADMPVHPDAITRGVKALQNADIISGRRNDGYPLTRKVVSDMYNLSVKTVLKTDFCDIQCGFKGFKKNAAQLLFKDSKINGFAMDTEIIFLAQKYGLKAEHITVNICHRKGSKVNMIKDGIKMFKDIIKIRTYYKRGLYDKDKAI